MHAGNPRQLGFEVRNRPQIWIVCVEVTKSPPQQREQLWFVVITLGADFNQLDKVSSGLSAEIIFADAGERILEDDFGQGVQGRFAAGDDRDLRFEKKIELARERSFGATRAFGHSLNAAERLGAPGNDQAGVAKLAFAQKNRGRALHAPNLARD